jgi:hypothetical protein
MGVQVWWLGSLSKGLRSYCHEPTVLLGERDVYWTRQLSSHACVVSSLENLTFLCHQDADNTPCLHLTHKPINAPAIPFNQAYHKSCKMQWLIRREVTYITFLCHEQTSISLKSGTRLPWKDTRGDPSRTYHCPWEKPETYSMSSHAYKRRGGKP